MVFLDTFNIKASTKGADISAEFLQQKGDSYHEALGAKAHYNQLTTWFEPLPEPGDTTADDDLRIALYEYNETTEEEFRLNLTSYSLNDVLLEIIEADGRYAARGKGIIHAHRQIARSTGNNAAAIGPWLDLIPADEGLSVLTGGLKAILDVCAIWKNSLQHQLTISRLLRRMQRIARRSSRLCMKFRTLCSRLRSNRTSSRPIQVLGKRR